MFGVAYGEEQKVITYDKEKYKPVIIGSSGVQEKFGGFRNINTGEFVCTMLIRTVEDMDTFLEKYDIAVAEIER